MEETGVLLLREENLDLEKAENLVKLQETTSLMMQGRMSTVSTTVETERVCYTCRKPGHLARNVVGQRARSSWARMYVFPATTKSTGHGTALEMH
ncbi:hypothetical protein JTB14_007120 [Gonioctena quinquepunctata]|nr:hypothetical protein JTB14_007120 [Gonioctena quinquepunctata]